MIKEKCDEDPECPPCRDHGVLAACITGILTVVASTIPAWLDYKRRRDERKDDERAELYTLLGRVAGRKESDADEDADG